VQCADLVVAAVGRAEMVCGSWIKAGATVIDVGRHAGRWLATDRQNARLQLGMIKVGYSAAMRN